MIEAAKAYLADKIRIKNFDIDSSSCYQSPQEKFKSDLAFIGKVYVKNAFEIKVNNLQDAVLFVSFNFADTLAVGVAYGATIGVALTPGLLLLMAGILTVQAGKLVYDTGTEFQKRENLRSSWCGKEGPLPLTPSSDLSEYYVTDDEIKDVIQSLRDDYNRERFKNDIINGRGLNYNKVEPPRLGEPHSDTADASKLA